jgi:TRAP-type C4-dicarboxylate transport system permease small subunit
MKKVIEFFDKVPVSRFLSSMFLIAMALIMTMNVILRYIFGFSFNWGDEILRYLCVFMAFFGTAAGFNSGVHIGIYVFVEHVIPEPARKYFRLFADLVTIAFLCFLTYYGIVMYNRIIATNQVSPALHVPMQFIYAVIPVMAVLSIIQMLIQIFYHKSYLKERV